MSLATSFGSCGPTLRVGLARSSGHLPWRFGAVCTVGRDYAPVGESVQPVRGKAWAWVMLDVPGPQQLVDQDIAFDTAWIYSYADRCCTHLYVWGGLPQDLPSHVLQHRKGFVAYVYPPDLPEV